MRIDIGVVCNDKLTDAIECKRLDKNIGFHTRQSRAYREIRDQYGVRIHIVNNPREFERIVDACK